MQLIIDEYNLKSKKIDKDLNIIAISDLHIDKYINANMLKIIIDFLNSEKQIDLITIPGDNMNAKNYNDYKCYNKLCYVLQSLSEIADCVISLGNHDIYKMNSEAKRKYLQLNKLNKVYALDNEQIHINGINITGFCPNSISINKSDNFVNCFRNCNFNFNNDDFNILLNHSPLEITNNDIQNKLNEIYNYIDLIIAGHMHNGYVPNFLENLLKDKIKDYGIYEDFSLVPPKLFSKINFCRGIHEIKNSKLIINKGFRKYAGYIPSYIPTNPSITKIKIKKMIY